MRLVKKNLIVSEKANFQIFLNVYHRGPLSDILIIWRGGGGVNRGSYFVPKKSQLLRISLPKIIPTF